jgi:hypothetical protein
VIRQIAICIGETLGLAAFISAWIFAWVALPGDADAKSAKNCRKVFVDNQYRFGMYVGPVYRWRCK